MSIFCGTAVFLKVSKNLCQEKTFFLTNILRLKPSLKITDYMKVAKSPPPLIQQSDQNPDLIWRQVPQINITKQIKYLYIPGIMTKYDENILYLFSNFFCDSLYLLSLYNILLPHNYKSRRLAVLIFLEYRVRFIFLFHLVRLLFYCR